MRGLRRAADAPRRKRSRLLIALVLGAVVTLAPEDVIARYQHALATAKAPPAYICEYNVTDRGTHPTESSHRIFREGGRERDELISYNGQALNHPEVRVFARRVDPYAVTMLAPRPETYAFTYIGAAHHGRNVEYVFKAFARGTPPYEATKLTIDGTSFLPLSISFLTHNKVTEGSGEVTYQKIDRYWMPQTASARAEVNGNLETERIVWSNFQFYPTLPGSTFAVPTAAIPTQN